MSLSVSLSVTTLLLCGCFFRQSSSKSIEKVQPSMKNEKGQKYPCTMKNEANRENGILGGWLPPLFGL
ncbi:hypothetical protein RND71_037526 [Anisodus tanguticus]|uniref:Uncharacterized protein n=1 Tax=Anisodus tanguticus TaxID=243964 RepID=A0AAE1R634_9SOLA|nr:hypothetical protein RND71_037526 [Anisodus tanguticus]